MPVGICIDILKAEYPVAQNSSQQFVEIANIVVLVDKNAGVLQRPVKTHSIFFLEATHVGNQDQIPLLVTQIKILLARNQRIEVQCQFMSSRLSLPDALP